ncbi:MAG TPA: sigma-70 family RNA polymerase sigma factor, partial [Steroidobacteraceae bacterium]|nr:sigma-70 family RNA polymerase sigma factor [Steroidobacteraceae bacterium]
DIRRYARRSCAAEHVDDAVQETLMILHRRVGTLRTLTSVSGWLVAVVRRECRRIERWVASRFAPEWEPAYENDEVARLDVCAAIESLPPHHREVVILRDFEELTVDEIGERLGLTREAVKGRLHRARGLLREYLSR